MTIIHSRGLAICFSKSCIIRQVQTKKIMTVIAFGYLILAGIDFYDVIPVFTLALVSIEKIYETLKTVFEKSKMLCHAL